MDPTIIGIAAVAWTIAGVLYVWTRPQRQPAAEPLPDSAAILTAERVRMHCAAANIADDESLPHGMTPALLDLADRLALDVHEGRRTPASAMQYITATCRQWTRAMREAGAA